MYRQMRIGPVSGALNLCKYNLSRALASCWTHFAHAFYHLGAERQREREEREGEGGRERERERERGRERDFITRTRTAVLELHSPTSI